MITGTLIAVCAVLAIVIGGGGFSLGCMIATDHADRQHADQLEAELELEQARRVPLARQVYTRPLVALADEPATTPMRAIPAALAACSAALGRMLGRPPDPAGLEAELARDAHQAELEIKAMIRHAETVVGRLGPGRVTEDV